MADKVVRPFQKFDVLLRKGELNKAIRFDTLLKTYN